MRNIVIGEVQDFLFIRLRQENINKSFWAAIYDGNFGTI